MYANDCALRKKKYFDDLGDIAGLIFEGKDLVDAAATKGMTAEEFKKALNHDIRQLNFEAYLTISKELLSKDEYLDLLAEEFWPETFEKTEKSSEMINAYIKYAMEIIGEENFQEFAERQIRFQNYFAYSLIAAKLKFDIILAP